MSNEERSAGPPPKPPRYYVDFYSLKHRERRRVRFAHEEDAKGFFTRLVGAEGIPYVELVRVHGKETQSLASHFAPEGGAS